MKIFSWMFMLSGISFVSLLPNPTMIQSRTSYIYHRYYLIRRLEQSCLLLQNRSIQKAIPFDRLNAALFKSDIIKSLVEKMKLEKSTRPFLALWGDFCAYKESYNDHFKYEFIEFIYGLYELIYPNRTKRLTNSLEHTLSAIDFVCNAQQRNRHPVQSSSQELIDVTTDLIAKRFYILKRLQKSMQFLNHLHEQPVGFINEMFTHRNPPIDLMAEIEYFHHERVRESIMQMCHAKNLEPLLRLCDEVKQYRFAQDEGFLQEMLMNIFLVYKTILFRHSSHYGDPTIVNEMNHVLEIYENLSSMPLDQTLEAIDLVTDKLMTIQAEEFAKPSYIRWALLSSSICTLVGLGAYYYFVHQG